LVRKTRKINDKLKEKKWITVSAPDSFNNIPVAYIPITDDKNAVGRVVEVTLFDILKGDPSQHQYKIFFQISKVSGEKATTIFKRYEYSKEFLRSLIRRGSSRINFIIDAKTKDGNVFRFKILTLRHRELNTSRKHALNVTQRIGISQHFDDIFDIIDSNFVPKPVMEPYKKLVEKHKIDPNLCVFVEDIARNLKPAYEIGMKTVWIENEVPWAKKFSDANFINYKTNNLSEFLKKINLLKAA